MARYILKRRPNSLSSVNFWYPTNDYVNDVSDSSNSTYISTVDPDATIVYNFSSSQFNGTVENVSIIITAAAVVPGYDYFSCYITVGGYSYGGTVYLDSTSYQEYILDIGTPPVANQSFTLTITSGVSTVGIYISEIRVELQVSDSQTSSFGFDDILKVLLVEMISAVALWPRSLMIFVFDGTISLLDAEFKAITKKITSQFGVEDVISEFIEFKTPIIFNTTALWILEAGDLVVLDDLISGFSVSLFVDIWNVVLVISSLLLMERILLEDFWNFDVLLVSSAYISANIFTAIDSELAYAIVNSIFALSIILDFQAGFAISGLTNYLIAYTNLSIVRSALQLFVPLQGAIIGFTDSLNTLRVIGIAFLISLTDRWKLIFEGVSRIGVGIGLTLRVGVGTVLKLSDKLRFFLRRSVINLIEQRKLGGDILRGFYSQARASFGRDEIKEQFFIKSGPNFAFSRIARREVFAVSSKPSFAYEKKVTAYHQKAPNLPASFGARFKFWS